MLKFFEGKKRGLNFSFFATFFTKISSQEGDSASSVDDGTEQQRFACSWPTMGPNTNVSDVRGQYVSKRHTCSSCEKNVLPVLDDHLQHPLLFIIQRRRPAFGRC